MSEIRRSCVLKWPHVDFLLCRLSKIFAAAEVQRSRLRSDDRYRSEREKRAPIADGEISRECPKKNSSSF